MSEPMPKNMEELLTQILTDMVRANVELGNLKQGYEKITEAIPLTQEWMEKMIGKLERLEQRVKKFGNKVMMTGNRLNALMDRVRTVEEQLERTGKILETIVMGVRPPSEEEEEEDPPSQ